MRVIRCCICKAESFSRTTLWHPLRHEVVCPSCGVYRIGRMREATAVPFWSYRERRRSLDLIRSANARGLVWDFGVAPQGQAAADDRHSIAMLANADEFIVMHDARSIVVCRRTQRTGDWIARVDGCSFATGIRHAGMAHEDAVPAIIAWYDRMKAAGTMPSAPSRTVTPDDPQTARAQ